VHGTALTAFCNGSGWDKMILEGMICTAI
jgi:hypothetical protein